MSSYKNFAIDLAYKSGDIIRKAFFTGVEKRWKKDLTPITDIDLKINDLVIESIQKTYPTYSILSEEQSSLKESNYVWVCDPIDGTVPFAHKIPLSVFSLALVFEGNPIFGVIYDPFLDRMAIGEKGKGSFLNKQKMRVSTNTVLENAVIDIETWSTSLYDLTSVIKHATDHGVMITTVRSVCYSSVLVAMGELSASIFAGGSAWDGAAVKIIVEEAGGKVTDLFGKEQSYDKHIKGFVASNGNIHRQLLDLIKKAIHT